MLEYILHDNGSSRLFSAGRVWLPIQQNLGDW